MILKRSHTRTWDRTYISVLFGHTSVNFLRLIG